MKTIFSRYAKFQNNWRQYVSAYGVVFEEVEHCSVLLLQITEMKFKEAVSFE